MLRKMCVYPHHIRVCGVGQSEGSAVVFLIQFTLFEVELIQSVTDLSTLLQGLGVLWMLKDELIGHNDFRLENQGEILSTSYAKISQNEGHGSHFHHPNNSNLKFNCSLNPFCIKYIYIASLLDLAVTMVATAGKKMSQLGI